MGQEQAAQAGHGAVLAEWAAVVMVVAGKGQPTFGRRIGFCLALGNKPEVRPLGIHADEINEPLHARPAPILASVITTQQ